MHVINYVRRERERERETPQFLKRNTSKVNITYWTAFKFLICELLMNTFPADWMIFRRKHNQLTTIS